MIQYIMNGALLSEDGRYRYLLSRTWHVRPADGNALHHVLWVMLNPSTADGKEDDATIRRCVGFSKLWGYHGLEVVNLFALRATNPRTLWKVDDPVGPHNDTTIANFARKAPLVVCAWGANALCKRGRERVAEVVALLGDNELHCLRLSKGGAPVHPLREPRTRTPIPFTP